MIKCSYLESYTDGDWCTLFHKICDICCPFSKSSIKQDEKKKLENDELNKG